MPEFILDTGNEDGATWYRGLDAFAQGYVQAMFFTECTPDNPDLATGTVAELSQKSRQKIVADCRKFKAINTRLLTRLEKIRTESRLESEEHGEPVLEWASRDSESDGMDFWYGRNGHGVGFWDRGYPGDVGDKLAAAAKTFGGVYVSAERNIHVE